MKSVLFLSAHALSMDPVGGSAGIGSGVTRGHNILVVIQCLVQLHRVIEPIIL